MRKKILIVVAAAVLTLFAIGCTLPEYQVAFKINGTLHGPISGPPYQYVDISYSVTNVGKKTVNNAMIQISYTMNSTIYGTVSYADWTQGISLGVYQTYTGTLRHTLLIGETLIATMPLVVGAGWDAPDSTSTY
jgi:hypothetical protein